MKPPQFPEPDPKDPPIVAYALRNAAALWAAGRHKDALPFLRSAAENFEGDSPQSQARGLELLRALAQIATFLQSGEDPRSIPISIKFDVESIDVASISIDSKEVEELPMPNAPAKPAKPAPPPKPLVLDKTLASGGKLEGAPKDWPYGKKKEASVPEPKIEEKSPAPVEESEFEDNPHGAPTRRMDDIVTLRDPNAKK